MTNMSTKMQAKRRQLMLCCFIRASRVTAQLIQLYGP